MFVGKIVKVTPKAKPYPTFEMKPFTCTVDPWKEACINKKWYATKNRPVETNPHYCVMAYFSKFNKGGSLPKRVLDVVSSTEIDWGSTNLLGAAVLDEESGQHNDDEGDEDYEPSMR
jgi:hypothetical protein